MGQQPYQHKARKRFGQNFLHDPGVIGRIIRSISAKPGQHMVEIGPGQGALTSEILACSGNLDVIELDRDLVPILLAQFVEHEGFRLHQGDALKFDFASLLQDDEQLRIVGNLPYNISTPLIFHLLSYAARIQDMHFMLQKEVVLRMAAGPGSSHYGRLGIMVQYYCQVDNLFLVGPGAFNPPPKVDSAIVRLTPYTELPHPAEDVKQLEDVVRRSFSMRRKTLRNNLKGLLSAAELEQLEINPGERPENISLAQFVKLANYLSARA